MTEKQQKEWILPSKKQPEAEAKQLRRRKAYNNALRGTIYVLTMVAEVAVLISTLVLPVLQIEGTGMEPTLSGGDIVLLMTTTRFSRGDLCGFTWNNKLLIKRVIGVPGDWIETIKEKPIIYVSNEAYRIEPLLVTPAVAAPMLLALLIHLLVKYREPPKKVQIKKELEGGTGYGT